MYKKTIYAKKGGGIAIALLMISFGVATTAGTYLALSLHNMRLNYRVVSAQRARILAESTLDAGTAQLTASIRNKELGLSSGDLQSQLDEAAERIKPAFSGKDANYSVAFLSLKQITEFVPTYENGKLVECMDILVMAAVSNQVDGVRSAFSNRVRVTREPFLRYALFFAELLELHPGPPMTINGDIRSNSNIEFWAGDRLNIHGQVFCPGTLILRKSDEPDSYSTEAQRLITSQKITVDDETISAKSFYQNGGVLDSFNSDWAQLSREVWDNKVIAGTEVKPLNPPIDAEEDNHVLIEPIKTSDSAVLKKEKLSHKADLYVKVSKSGAVTATWKGNTSTISSSSYANPVSKDTSTGQYSFSTGSKGWIKVHSSYYDPRESEEAYTKGAGSGSPQQMQMVDLYMDKLIGAYPGASLVYVEVEDPNNTALKPAVRLRNGGDLSAVGSGGISVATHRTAYVEGNFNTNTKVPTMIAADNLTLLSNAWTDTNSGNYKTASSTTLNAALLIGYADPENLKGNLGSTLTGGAHNLLRFRENWDGKNYNFSGSYISLWTAQDSHCIVAGYYPPNRNITYDADFRTTEPPGMPIGYSVPETVLWEELEWSEAVALKDGFNENP